MHLCAHSVMMMTMMVSTHLIRLGKRLCHRSHTHTHTESSINSFLDIHTHISKWGTFIRSLKIPGSQIPELLRMPLLCQWWRQLSKPLRKMKSPPPPPQSQWCLKLVLRCFWCVKRVRREVPSSCCWVLHEELTVTPSAEAARGSGQMKTSFPPRLQPAIQPSRH